MHSPQHLPGSTDMGMVARVPLLVLLALTSIAYSSSFAGTWQFDDWKVIVLDARVQSIGAWWVSMPAIRPLFKLSVAVNNALPFGLVGFHAFNLLVHLANIALVWMLMQRLLPVSLSADARTARTALATGVFALHPVQTEAVTYISGRSVSLAALFLLLTVLCHLESLSSLRRSRWQLMAVVAYAAAMASRETAVIAPILALLAARAVRPADSWRQHGSAAMPLLVAMVVMLLGVLALPRYRELLFVALRWEDAGVLLATQTQALCYMLQGVLGLHPVNPDPAVIIAPLYSIKGMAAVALLCSYLLLLISTWRGHPVVATGLAWALVVWLPTHTVLLRLDPVNDRHLYLALPGLMLALAAAPVRWQHARYWATAAMLVMLVGLAALSWRHNRIYRDEVTYWRYVTAAAPHNPRGWNNLGVALADEHDMPVALRCFQRALDLDHQYVKAAVNWTLVEREQWRSQRDLTAR